MSSKALKSTTDSVESADLYMTGSVISHARCHAVLLEGVCGPHNWSVHLLVRQICHHLPRGGICKEKAQTQYRTMLHQQFLESTYRPRAVAAG